ncbi:hydrogenase maturation nickel metallochaperone HypA [candidate division KSB1 bacterium]|nr:hydrogenase maturation nickel metallochaperone HypA [candidate division KSB1 bacterium]
MHELSIIESIIDIILSEMPKHNMKTVDKISLRIGEMRQVVPEALHFGFDCLSANTPLEGAELFIESVPIKGRCKACESEFRLGTLYQECEKCNSTEVEIVSGKELEIAEFEGS